MRATCIVPSAGKGKRLSSKENKPFISLKGKPLLLYTLKALEKCKVINEIIVVVSPDKIKTCKKLIKKYGISKVSVVVAGGRKRFNSVKNGLKKIKEADFILIHDGVRPFIEESTIKKVLRAARRYGAALCATPLKQTLKIINKNSFIKNTPKRSTLWEAQTPQAFKKDLILKAYKNATSHDATDDSSLVEKMGRKVKIIKGSYRNIKITTPEDLALAEILLKK